MDMFILIISTPLFLIVVLLLSLFVLANYSGRVPEQSTSPTEHLPATQNQGVDQASDP
jgi:hypothetical protein